MSQPLYHETYRPQFHFSARRDWINDPNGLVYYDGEYHLCFQHTPGSLEWGPNTWGHAVSRDLVHWRQIEHAIEPDEMGWIWSGSAVVDWGNTTGLQTGAEKPLIACYTTGDNTEKSHRPCVQCIASSNDRGRTWQRWEGNPVLGHVRADNRDPKVVRHAPSGQWVMALFLDGEDYALFGSPDMRSWTHLCDLRMPGVSECPDLYELALDGDPDETWWVFSGANGGYRLGSFDGKTFVPQTETLRSHWGGNSYAGQTWSDIPSSDGRRIQITWMAGGRYPGMPFNQQMSFPVALTLRTTEQGPRLFQEPVSEVELLYDEVDIWRDAPLRPDEDLLDGMEGELWDIEAWIDLGTATEVGFVLRGERVSYRVPERTIGCLGKEAPLVPRDGRVHLRILLDRASIEVFANRGEIAMPTCFVPEPGETGLSAYALGGEARLVDLEVRRLRSAWE